MNSDLNLKSELSYYSSRMRKIEILSLVLFGVLFIDLNRHFFSSSEAGFISVLICMGLAYVLADIVSGMVHWFADTWGSYEWPIVGNSLIRSFREHHADPLAMTHHDFIEVNGATALVSLPVLVFCWFKGFSQPFGFYLCGIITWLSFFTIMTGQIHKWAHLKNPSTFIQILQKYRIILSPKHHSFHHSGNIDSHYCITTGWLNPLFSRISFFRILEEGIHKLTGAIPRSDDFRVLAGVRNEFNKS